MKKSLIIMLCILLPLIGHSQESYWVRADSLYKFVSPSASLQFWSAYTMNEKDQLQPNGPLEDIQDRLNFLIRRARFGFKGKPYSRISYVFTAQYDNLGKDKLGGVRGSTNTGQFGVLDAFTTWRITNKETLNLTAGYFHPQFSRECITGDLLVNSLDKAPTQGYIRNHINGKGYGRSTGLNAGGLIKTGSVTINYNVGIFNNNTTAADVAESTGKYWSPIVVERVTFTFGDAEMKSYQINYDANNYYSKRRGVTIGLNNSTQGRTDIFTSNYAQGADVLLNYDNLNLDGEWVTMHRTVEGTTFESTAMHLRGGYNVIIAKKIFLEPSVMYVRYHGDTGAESSGKDEMYDFGVNWYLNKKFCKLAAHYVKQSGYGDNGYTDESTFKKGDFITLAFVLLL